MSCSMWGQLHEANRPHGQRTAHVGARTENCESWRQRLLPGHRTHVPCKGACALCTLEQAQTYKGYNLSTAERKVCQSNDVSCRYITGRCKRSLHYGTFCR